MTKRDYSLHTQKKVDESELSWIKEKMIQHKTIEKSFELAQKLSQEAQEIMSDDEDLVNILQTMIKRSY